MPSSSQTPLSAPQNTRRPTQFESLFAGVIAGAIEGAITYPTEYVKTQAQFASKTGAPGRGVVLILRDTLRDRGVRGLYSGSGALIAGNGLKAGVRFMSYDTIKQVLRTPEGKMTPGRTVVAGMCAGAVEAVVAVTPSETIKTKLIQDASSSRPIYSGTINGTIAICKTEGFGGIYRGLAPTIAKQSANSAVRFTSYASLQTFALDYLKPASGKLDSATTFGLGAIAGLITVYSTMPLDNVKTRMQAIGAESRYRNSLHCLTTVIKEEGLQRLWGGATPRLARLMMSGGIVFAVYEKLIDAFTAI